MKPHTQKISLVVGVLGLIAIGWFLISESSIDHVATVDDELFKLEQELSALEADGYSESDTVIAKDRINARLQTINSSLDSGEDRPLNDRQQLMLNEGLARLQRILEQNQTVLATTDTSGDNATITAIAATINTIEAKLPTTITTATDPDQATYTIRDTAFSLQNGRSLNGLVQLLGNQLRVDLNNDDRNDAVVVLEQQIAQRVEYFVAPAINTSTGWQGKVAYILPPNAIDVQVQSTPTDPRSIAVTFSVQGANETFDLLYDLEQNQFVTATSAPATDNQLILTDRLWTWVSTTIADDSTTPDNADEFTLNFSNGTVIIATDCNVATADYEIAGDQLTLLPITATEMFCADAQESDFLSALQATESFMITNAGELTLTLTGGGTMSLQ